MHNYALRVYQFTFTLQTAERRRRSRRIVTAAS